MGFFDALGSIVGKMAAMGQEIQGYKSEYESMSDNDLKRAYENLKNKSGTEERYRLMAVMSVLKDRGLVRQSNR
jgi:hypothetical protein